MGNRTGITEEKLKELGDKKIILENLSWKPDRLLGENRLFFPYLDIKFVKQRIIDVCGPGNVQFNIEKDAEIYATGSMGILIDGEWIWNSAIGTERDSNLTDKTKKNKVKYKGNHADAFKACSELFGLTVPREITSKTLPEKNKVVFTLKGKQIGHIEKNKESVNAYLNNLNRSILMLAQVYNLNQDEIKSHPEIEESFKNISEFLKEKGV